MNSILLNVSRLMPDEMFLRVKYRIRQGEKLNLKNPETFNEKLQWLKLHDRKDIYTRMVDKCDAKKYVADVIGEKYIIPTLGVYDKFDDIDFDKLPGRFVIKCTHDSGGLVICRDKAKLDIPSAREKINKSLKRKYYYVHREWPYKNVKPRIIVEKYMEGNDKKPIMDYKFFCFNGKPELLLVCSDRFNGKGLKETWLTPDWKLLPLTEGGHDIDRTIKKPSRLELMKKLAGKITKGMPFLRVDFYEIDGEVFFGEMTFSPCAGFEKFDPPVWNKKLGDLIDLNLVKK